MVKVINKRENNNGQLFHYAHFIKDCLFNEILADFHLHKKVVRQKILDQTLGNFSRFYEDVMGIETTELPEKEFEELEDELVITHRINKPTKEQMDKFRQFIFQRYSIEEDPTFPEILLIERGGRIELINDEELKKINTNVSTGRERREINQIEKVKEFLEKEHSGKYKTIMLEQLSFQEQIKYFYNAKTVIGCHGAGLINILFCREHTTLIEVNPENYRVLWNFLINSCQVLNVKHIYSNNNIKDVLDVLELFLN